MGSSWNYNAVRESNQRPRGYVGCGDDGLALSIQRRRAFLLSVVIIFFVLPSDLDDKKGNPPLPGWTGMLHPMIPCLTACLRYSGDAALGRIRDHLLCDEDPHASSSSYYVLFYFATG